MPNPIPYFKRAWHISVDTQGGQHIVLTSNNIENALRATFYIKTAVLLAYWDAEVVIYNVNDKVTQAVSANAWNFNTPLNLGDGLSISAGYESSSTGQFSPETNEIYSGSIFQPLWTRENVTDFKLTLRCLVGLFQDAYNFVNFTLPAGVSSYDLVKQTADRAGIPFAGNDSVDQTNLSLQKFSRGQTIFSRPYDKFRQVARDNNMFAWMSQTKSADGTSTYGLNLRSLKFDPDVAPAYTYAPINVSGQKAPQGTTQGLVKYTLIETPEQTQQGIMFKVLLDSQPRLGDIVQIAPGTAINRLPFSIGSYPGILDQRGLYVISEIVHIGDTRGGNGSWYTQITGLTYQFFPSFLLTAPGIS